MTEFPALPSGFVLEQPKANNVPPPPAGFQIEGGSAAPAEDAWQPPGMLVPVQFKEGGGDWRFATPQIVTDLMSAITAPGDALAGKMNELEIDPITGEIAPFSTQMIERSAGMAGLATGGTFPRVTGRMLTEAGQVVPQSVVRSLGNDGVPLPEVSQRVQQLGPQGVVADLGQNVRDKAGAIATSPGPGQSVVVDTMRTRQMGAPGRVTAAVDDVLGAAPVPSYVQQEIRANQRVVGPEYEPILAGAAPVDTSALASSLEANAASLRGNAQSALQTVRSMLNQTGTGELDNSAATLFQVRQAVDGMLSGQDDANVRRVLSAARTEIDGLLAQAAPGIKDVDARYAELARQGEAVDLGQTVLGSGRNDLRPQELADRVAQGAVPGGDVYGPSGVPFRLSQGARAEIDRLFGTNVNDRVALASMLKGESDWNRQRLITLFGEERTDALYRLLDNERAMALTENQALAGSKTASLTAARDEINGPRGGPGVFQSLADLKPGTAAVQLMDRALGGALDRRRQASNAAIADALMSQGNWTGETAMTPVPVGGLLEVLMQDTQPPQRQQPMPDDQLLQAIMRASI